MATGNSKTANGSALEFEAQLWAAAEQAVPAPNRDELEYQHVETARRNVAQASAPASSGSVPAARRNTRRGRPVNPQTRTSALQSCAEGKGGGEFYTPQSVVQLLVSMLEPFKGRVFETLQSANMNCRNRRMNRRGIQNVRGQRWPCASTSGGMFVQSEKFVEEHGGRVGDIAVYGQESNCSVALS